MSPRLLAAASLAGLAAALLIPGNIPGVNIPIVALTVGAAVVVARPRPSSVDVWLLAAGATLLVLVPAIRAAEWVGAISALVAIGAGFVAVTGVPTWSMALRAAFFPLVRLLPAVRAMFKVLPLKPDPRRNVGPAVRGTLIATVLVVVFGVLFASADAAFAELASRLVPDVDLGLVPVRVFVFGAIVMGTIALAASGPSHAELTPGALRPYLDLRDRSVGDEAADGGPARSGWKLSKTEWSIALSALVVLFGLFIAVQLTVMFGGHELVLQTAGLTYAEYARSGFFELIVAGGLTLLVVGTGAKWADRKTAADEWLFRILLGSLCVLTLVVLLSALKRLGLYEEAYGFTRARVFAHLVLLWMAGVYALVMTAGIIRRRGWALPGFALLTCASVIVFAGLNPDAFIARKNIERFERSSLIDGYYLAHLSADALPELSRLSDPALSCILSLGGRRWRASNSWPGWNLGRAHGLEVLRTVPPEDVNPSVCQVYFEPDYPGVR